jgi:hypothetical protein
MPIFPQGLSHIEQRCANRGERALLQQLQRCLSDEDMVWYKLPIGPQARQPDFLVLSPSQGLLLLEVRHWKRQTLAHANGDSVVLKTKQGRVTEANPLRKARDYAKELAATMARDPALTHDQGPFAGRLRFPYGWGVVFSGLTAKEVEGLEFHRLFPSHRVLMRDDLGSSVKPAMFLSNLWGMFSMTEPHRLTLPERDRVRWHLFPDLRVQQLALLEEGDEAPALQVPELPRVMDLQQEQLARALGEGHRIIHGAAGSGKTAILVLRAQQLAAAARPDQPVLVLCHNQALAQRIDAQLRNRGVDGRALVRTFHGWCQDMAQAHQLELPKGLSGSEQQAALTQVVVKAVETGAVPRGRYTAVLVDEAHDFEDSWLWVAARQVSPATDSLLVLYDDAQAMHPEHRRRFNFASLGIHAQGRSSILKLNYRNTAEILALAIHFAPTGEGEGGEGDASVLSVLPASAGRHGPAPELLLAKSGREEAELVADRVTTAIVQGRALDDVAILFRTRMSMVRMAEALRGRGVPVQTLHEVPAFDWSKPSVKLMTLHSVKGLEFPMVVLAALETLPFGGEPLSEEVRLLYVGMTRATDELLLSAASSSVMVQRVQQALADAADLLDPA